MLLSVKGMYRVSLSDQLTEAAGIHGQARVKQLQSLLLAGFEMGQNVTIGRPIL
jgi:hypothetical protein